MAGTKSVEFEKMRNEITSASNMTDSQKKVEVDIFDIFVKVYQSK